jgi:hypothetical protein
MRNYIPKVGEKVKLSLLDHYQQLDAEARDCMQRYSRSIVECASSVEAKLLTEDEARRIKEKLLGDFLARCKAADVPGLWAWFKVLEAGSEKCKLEHIHRAVDAPGPAWSGEVPTSWVAPPISWKPVYDIVCSDRLQAEKVVNDWLKRGIHVWCNHDMSSCNAGGAAFTPFGAGGRSEADPASPNWRYTGSPTESVPAELCPSVFRVLISEQRELDLPIVKKVREKEVAELRKEPGVTVDYDKRSRTWFWQKETLVHQPKE